MTSFAGPSAPFKATTEVPGDKSLSHRALILAAMAGGTSRITGLAPGRDVAASGRALREVGIHLERETLHSPGIEAWLPSAEPLDLENSGTALRLLCGALAGRPYRSILVGDDSLMRRPMRRLAEPLARLGATVEVSADGTPPVAVTGGSLRGATVQIPMPSAQVRTATMLAALQAEGSSLIDSPPGFRDHTERWLASLGLGRYRSATAFEIGPGPVPPGEYQIPGDASSAAFLWAAAALIPNASVTVPNVSLNPGRTGFLDVLTLMGARVDRSSTGTVLGDPVGDVRVVGAALHGIVVGGDTAARAVDELPLVGILAAAADGTTRVRDAGELRVKESDRIASTVGMICAVGGTAEATDDGFVVTGTGTLQGGTVDAAGDHRIAMAGAVAATASRDPIEVLGFEAAGVSWPEFDTALEALWSSR
jgi:3-phosphoshikimate 1-carboxyvinyltransferase